MQSSAEVRQRIYTIGRRYRWMAMDSVSDEVMASGYEFRLADARTKCRAAAQRVRAKRRG